MSRSGSFDVDDARPRCQRGDDQTTPSTTGFSVSQLSTPIMSQQKALALLLNTPPSAADNGCDSKLNVESLNNDFNTLNNDFTKQEAQAAMLPLSSQRTPQTFQTISEPPAWKPPEADEIEYTDAWNNAYISQHHYLQPGCAAQDDSTIGSSQTNNSMANNFSIGSSNALRPRGLSLCSHADDPSIGSCHRRHPSLPVSFFSSALHSGQNQQLFPPQKGTQNQLQTSKQFLNLLQPTTKSTPYELHSHNNISQVQVDGAMAGLSGILLDLYTVDRTLDGATAKMVATKKEGRAARNDGTETDDGCHRKKGNKQSSSRRPRKTAVGTLKDIQCILQLHKVDKIVDRFKRGLQMPEFFEEEARESNIWKDLRRTDVEMGEYSRKIKSDEGPAEAQQRQRHVGQGAKDKVQYQFDLSCDEDGLRWDNRQQDLDGDSIYASTKSCLTDYDAYQFFDPHETGALQANSYRSSQVSASINDDLHEIIDLLRTDVEVDGASKHHSEMEMIRPLLEVDQVMNKWKMRAEAKGMWDKDLRALYLTDLEVDGAPRKYAPNSQKAENVSAALEVSTTRIDVAKQQYPIPPIHATASSQEENISPADFGMKTKSHTDQEVRAMLYQHIPQTSQPFCPTSPELLSSKATVQASDFTLLPTAHRPPPEQYTRRAIFSTRENSKVNLVPKAVPTKRSIFSRQEKSSAESQCAFQRGVMMPGTTTVVVANGGEMIGDIPVGRVFITDAVGGASIR